MGTDPFFNTGALNRGFAGILDTGVRSTHTMFNPPRPWLLRDETGSGSISDTCGNHGTSTMAIMTGNANLGDRLRGISAITTDSIKVYDCIVDPVTGQLRAGLNRDAAIRGFQTAVNIMDRTIVAEMQAVENENGLIAAAADRAFDAGAVVIAANGNFGADQNGNPIPGSVRSPAVAQKVIGIGAFDVRTGITSLSQGRGPAPDGRTKPDIQTPTNTETASNVSDTSTQVFGGTSCATAQAGGAAAYLRSFLFAANEAPPGFVYAQLIARGTSTSFLDNTTGAGPIRLPVPGQSSSFPQQVTIAGGQSVDIPVFNSTVFFNGPLRAAIWWPEAPATHNDIDLRLIAPNGAVVGSSLSIGSVYEKVSVTGLTPGEWKIRVSGFSVPGGSQTVFAGVTIDNI
ncbi:S8 family serine peptidase [Actinophytocola sp.]|uniref:S8 family serine peptidase n=1 Tax=Actinophytocola sp. TaxID=1872138 RepID=UPI0039C880EB